MASAAGGLAAQGEAADGAAPTSAEPTAGLVQEALAGLGAEAGDGALRLLGEGVTTRHVADPTAAAAVGVLEAFRDRGDCVLAQAGYVDLAGSVWACTVQGDGWVEVTVVREATAGGSDVTSVHMDVETWEAELSQEVGEEA